MATPETTNCTDESSSAASFAHPYLAFLDDDDDDDDDDDEDVNYATNVTSTHTDNRRRPSSSSSSLFSIQSTPLIGSVVIATEAIPPNTVLFQLPQSRLISYQRDVCATRLSEYLFLDGLCTTTTATNSNNSDDGSIVISPEELTWLNMIAWLHQKDGSDNGNSRFNHCYIYLKALDTVPPNLASWPQHLQDLLDGTNINNNKTDGSNNTAKSATAAVNDLLALLERLRTRIPQVGLPASEQERKDADSPRNLLLQGNDNSIFTKAAISWARGHMLSRHFPDFMNDTTSNMNATTSTAATIANIHMHIMNASTTHSTATANKNGCCFIPVLDLMNHNPDQPNTCKLATVQLPNNNNKQYLQVTTGEHPVAAGDELHYCYGTKLSNEVLLQAYGFCLENNPADTVSVRIVRNTAAAAAAANSNDDNNDYVGVIGRGGVSAIPAELWKVIAAAPSSSSGNSSAPSDEVEIGSGDLELLKEYFDTMLQTLLLTMSGTKTTAATSPETKRDNDDEQKKLAATRSGAIVVVENTGVDKERRRYIQIYKDGQREILKELVRDLTLMMQG